ncbi:MAG: hypothetical protein WAL25_12725 [Acidimicrobiia bacterium]
MEPERDEVFERIPWETLEKGGRDRQWLAYAVAAAVVLGAIAYSITRNQPVAPVAAPAPLSSTVPATTRTSAASVPPSTVPGPIVVAEADLFAVDSERLFDTAAGHAEWFAVEYISVDGSEESRRVLAGLMPPGIPLPDATEGTEVFVDWAGATMVTQTGPTTYDVEVVVRSLLAGGDGGFVRQPPVRVGVPIAVSEDGLAQVGGVPTISAMTVENTAEVGLVEVPADVASAIELEGEVVGGRQGPDGWELVVLAAGTDGVTRPVTVRP